MEKIILLTFLLCSFSAKAFFLNTSTGAAFDNEVSIYVTSNSTCTNAGITKERLLEIAVQAAEKYWNRVPTANLTLKRGGILTTTDNLFLTGKLCATGCNAATDVPAVNDIVIACNNNSVDNFPSSAYLALTAPNNLSSSKISGSVILINDTATTSFNTLSSAEVESVLAHEIGHAIGLGHTGKTEAMMYHLNNPDRKKLAKDDVDGVSYLYPNQFDGCKDILGLSLGLSDPKDPPSNNNFILSLFMGLSVGFLSLFGWIKFTPFFKNRRRLVSV